MPHPGKQRQRGVFVRFPGMTHPKEAEVKLRSQSVDLRSEKLKKSTGKPGRLLTSCCTLTLARRPIFSWLTHLHPSFLSCLPTTQPHPHLSESLYFNIKFFFFFLICVNSTRSEYTEKQKEGTANHSHVTPLMSLCPPLESLSSHLIYGYIFLNKP